MFNLYSFVKGILIRPTTSDSSFNRDGSLFVDSADLKLKLGSKKGIHRVVTHDQAETIINKSIDGKRNTLTNIPAITITDLKAFQVEATTPAGYVGDRVQELLDEIGAKALTSGSQGVPPVNVSANTTLAVNKFVYIVDASASAIVISLPPINDLAPINDPVYVHSGKSFAVKAVGDATELMSGVTVQSINGALIDGKSTFELKAHNQAAQFVVDGTVWKVL